jgi:hypothetical protein
MASKKAKPPKTPRTRGFRAYPLHALPPNWTVAPGTLEAATSIKRIKENIVIQARAGVNSARVAIFAGADPPFVKLRLAKLSVDAIERLDVGTGEESLIELEDGQYFADSVHFVVDTSNGLAMGEYRPSALSVLGRWPGTLISAALAKLGTPEALIAQPVDFEPFPTPDFLERAVGRSVKKFRIKFGPISSESLESAGISSQVVEQLRLEGNILSFGLDISVRPEGVLNKGTAHMITSIARRLSEAGARSLMVTLDDREAFDLLNDNFLSYGLSIVASVDAGGVLIRTRTLDELRSELVKREKGLLGMLG